MSDSIYCSNPDCSSELTERDQKKYCSRSCSAKINNRQRKRYRRTCLHCQEPLTNKQKIYCSPKCQWDQKRESKVRNGTAGFRSIKRFLIETYGSKCWECGITEWNNKPITFEIEHIDGNSTNNDLSNLSILCPNCHSQTSTYKGRNIGKGRYKRRELYAQGKSY